MPMRQLTQVLRDTLHTDDERLLVGPEGIDDAGVVLLGEGEGLSEGTETALVQTIDYFPPVVDDPYYYGAIAAANSLSDVYAMGGRPLSALTTAGFPKDFELDWIEEIFRGGFAKVREAGAVVAGGHTVQSPEPHFGFSITGTVARSRVASNDGARVGDVFYLTKPLGCGSMTTAGKFGKISWDDLKPAADWMATLNDRAAAAMNAVGANACTDVTGFGLVGHAHNIARASRVTIELELGRAPLHDGALDLAREGVLSGGTKRGKDALGETVDVSGDLEPALVNIAFDAETSGGLLIAVSADRAADLERELADRDQLVARVGRAVEARDHRILLR